MVEVRFINDTTPIEVTSDEQVTEIQVGVLAHNDLSGRDLPDQHPISAITGLQDALDMIPTDYVSDAELEAALLEKQDVIRDLSEIRQGATLGATAIQPSELESYATKDYVDNGLSDKQNTLTAGANIQIIGDTISATDTTYTAGTGISIVDNVISNTQTSAEWGNITGDLSDQTDLQTVLNAKANTADLATVATSGSYDDLTDKPTIGNATLTIQKNSTNVDTFMANATVDKIINITVPTTASEVSALPDTTKYGATIDLSLNTTDYKLTLTLKDQNGTTLNSKVVDFPIESVVVNGSYDSINQKIVLTLQNGNTIDIPVGALIAGLQTEITASNKLDADLVTDSTSTNKFVTSSEKSTWNGKQDTISDLATIRTNATNGASAYTTIQGYGNIVTHNVSEFATSAQGVLADSALQSGDNISELLNDSGFITSSALNGYATESWVGQQGYLTSITSANVIAALGYTPYSAANPNGYITNSALAPYALSADLATVATSGLYSDLSGTPTIPTVNNPTITFTQGGNTKGTITLNQASNQTIAFDAGGGGGSYTAGDGIDITGTVISVDTTVIAQQSDIPTNNNQLTNGAGYITSSALSPYALSADLATVATSGAYSDLSGTPTIPTDTGDLTNGAGFITGITSSDVTTALGYTPYNSSNPSGYITSSALTGYATESYVTTATANMQTTGNLVTSISSTSTDTQYPSAKCVYDIVGDIESAINTIRGV